MALICNRCGEMFTLEEYNKMKNKLEVRPIIGGEVCRAIGRPAWTFFAGGWKTTTSAVS